MRQETDSTFGGIRQGMVGKGHGFWDRKWTDGQGQGQDRGQGQTGTDREDWGHLCAACLCPQPASHAPNAPAVCGQPYTCLPQWPVAVQCMYYRDLDRQASAPFLLTYLVLILPHAILSQPSIFPACPIHSQPSAVAAKPNRTFLPVCVLYCCWAVKKLTCMCPSLSHHPILPLLHPLIMCALCHFCFGRHCL